MGKGVRWSGKVGFEDDDRDEMDWEGPGVRVWNGDRGRWSGKFWDDDGLRKGWRVASGMGVDGWEILSWEWAWKPSYATGQE
ncbi:hypothetical protein MLD38_010943 [Melastoma candidum]|uniref:Uncharacterized protein n=1 Tax=Melastoma candidum TaxID=119954 RepID=A0ACB9R3A3_9MYRT|nr:hypothetical protein MLD38_010943 [Melastoma candidum]